MLVERALPHYSYQDYEQWEGEWELIEGVPYAMAPAPSLQHQRISHRLAWHLENLLAGCDQCEALLAVDWRIDNHTVVQPDNLVTCHQEEGQYLRKAPALIFEILSPSTEEKDRLVKFGLYQQEGVRYYCLLGPGDGVAKIFQLKDGRYIQAAEVSSETWTFDLGPCSLELDFSSVWPEGHGSGQKF
ncbi:MAG: Uma2 family endonuclease [Gammaproteobacteria bacterium]|nr:Uma2 family endonuclease [Gammaproteobacteria bacterium]MBU1655381.1 Uma2 family endonuclease [Gammaproteobacteria bacterium]MBU1961834.1 Uma2 family endonuclease [Gammaproteobacteria bacterium]